MSKTKDWIEARKKLIPIYKAHGIVRCEHCRGNWALSFHHLDKRSRTGGGTHTFEATRLLCAICHDLAEYDEEINDELRKIR